MLGYLKMMHFQIDIKLLVVYDFHRKGYNEIRYSTIYNTDYSDVTWASLHLQSQTTQQKL